MSESPHSQLPEDNFDVEAFAHKVYSLWRTVLSKLFYPVALLFQKPLRLVLFLLVAGGVAAGLKAVLPPVYEAKMYLVPMNRADLNVINLMYDLQVLAEDKDREQLAALLHVDADVAGSITGIKGKAVWKGHAPDTFSLMEVTVKSKRTDSYPAIEKGIQQYLESNEHYARVRRLRKQEVEQMQQKIKSEMVEIDSLKNLLVRSLGPRNAGGFVYGEPLDPVRVYDNALSLYRQKISLQWQENYLDNFEVVKSFVVSSRPSSPRLSRLLMITVAASLILLMVANARSNRTS